MAATQKKKQQEAPAPQVEARIDRMEAFCQQQTGMSLHEYAQQLRDSESQTPEMQM